MRDAIKHTDFIKAMGKPVSFDDHNQGAKVVVIDKVDHRRSTWNRLSISALISAARQVKQTSVGSLKCQ